MKQKASSYIYIDEENEEEQHTELQMHHSSINFQVSMGMINVLFNLMHIQLKWALQCDFRDPLHFSLFVVR